MLGGLCLSGLGYCAPCANSARFLSRMPHLLHLEEGLAGDSFVVYFLGPSVSSQRFRLGIIVPVHPYL